jgi:hypothetical protein
MSDRPDNLLEPPPPVELVKDPPPVELVGDPTDADLDEIEDHLLEKLLDEEEAEILAATPRTGVGGRKPRKEKLIEDIEKFRNVCPEILQSNWKLKKTRIGDLEVILARCVSAASGHPLRPGTAASAPSAPPAAQTPAASGAVGPALDPRLNQPGLNGKTIAGTMVDLNVLAMEVAEFGTQVAAPYTGGYVVEGAARELRAREKELEDIIRNVYADNKEICDKFVSPMLAWSSMMASVALRNVKKIDEGTGELQSLTTPTQASSKD